MKSENWTDAYEGRIEAEIDGVKIYGIYPYTSMLAGREAGRGTEHDRILSRRVLNFKKHGMAADFFFAQFEKNAADFGTDLICACPGHKTEINQLQEKYGVIIKRIKETETRKYDHKAELDLTTVELTQDITGKKILLIDDVATTGKSLITFAAYLEMHGAAEVICLCAGLNVKILSHNEPDKPETVEQPEEEQEQAGNEESEPEQEETPETVLECCGEAMIPLENALLIAEIDGAEFDKSEKLQNAYRKGQLRTDFEYRRIVINRMKEGDSTCIKLYAEMIAQEILPLNEQE